MLRKFNIFFRLCEGAGTNVMAKVTNEIYFIQYIDTNAVATSTAPVKTILEITSE